MVGANSGSAPRARRASHRSMSRAPVRVSARWRGASAKRRPHAASSSLARIVRSLGPPMSGSVDGGGDSGQAGRSCGLRTRATRLHDGGPRDGMHRMLDKNLFDRYLLALRKTRVDQKTELTDRSALEALLQAIANEFDKGISVQHEPKRLVDKGAPDLKISKAGLILGYVENKAIGEALDKVLKSDQIARYKTLSQNIILTDYLHFIWINKDGVQRETLCHETDLENRKFELKDDRVAAVVKLLHGFFSTAPDGIGRS